ncbi:ABC transporter permease subunit [Paenibacillus sp. DMB5]|uniref:ABC transporter permease subunit n=1 Tax=Paenibacillus sp. DMB5 TaxID=1780103 RepID=UPI00076CF7F9|nr:ABC transporter permease subunit [Paenibacillus sp. DMB5]KUP25614.1 hypothetical protein AWJ19_20435 [Paenibacillus sp. DMB5]
MLNLIQADLFKLRKSAALKLLLAITTVCAVVMAVFARLIPEGSLDAGATGLGFLFSDVNVISILGGVAAGLLVCGDLDNKTIHDAVANGYSRFTLLAGKAAVFSLMVVLLLLPYAVITWIALGTGAEFSMGSAALGFLNVLTSGSSVTAAGAPRMLAVILSLLIVYAAQLSICLPVAFWIKKPVIVVAIAYGFSMLTGQLMQLSARLPVLKHVLAVTPYGENYIFITPATAAGDMLTAILVSAGFAAVMLGLSYLLFRRTELK